MAIPHIDTHSEAFKLRAEGAKDVLMGGVSTAAFIAATVSSGGATLTSPAFDIALAESAIQTANGLYTGIVKAHDAKMRMNAVPSSSVQGGTVGHEKPAGLAPQRTH